MSIVSVPNFEDKYILECSKARAGMNPKESEEFIRHKNYFKEGWDWREAEIKHLKNQIHDYEGMMEANRDIINRYIEKNKELDRAWRINCEAKELEIERLEAQLKKRTNAHQEWITTINNMSKIGMENRDKRIEELKSDIEELIRYAYKFYSSHDAVEVAFEKLCDKYKKEEGGR